MITCYLDESGTDGDSPTAVMGGLLLDHPDFFWLDNEWRKVLDRYKIDPPLHMKEFVPHGRFKHVSHNIRRSLFSDLVRVINDHKLGSIAATLTTEQYRRSFAGVVDEKKGLSVYGACFVQLAMVNGVNSIASGYHDPIPFLLDSGNPYTHHVVDAHAVVLDYQKEHPLNAGTLTFDTDDNICALQAADIVSWSVRRRLAGKFNNGFEPLTGLFDQRHIEQNYEETWMIQVADALRANMKL